MRLLRPLALTLLASPALALQETGHVGLLSRRTTEGGEGFLSDRPYLSGDWSGRRWLEEHGVVLQLGTVSDSSWPLSGGHRHRRTDRLLFDAGLELDLERLAGLGGTVAFAELYSLAGRNGSDDVGDVQGFSNIDADHVHQLAALWIERSTEDGLRAKLGKADVNADFAHPEAGLHFLHSSAGFSPTIFLMPTYPDPAVGLSVFVRPAEDWSAGIGVYDSEEDRPVSGRKGLTPSFEALFTIAQVNRVWDELAGCGPGRFALGGWLHTGDALRFDGGRGGDSSGAFAILEQRLSPGTRGFLQWGTADPDVTEFAAHYGAGVVHTGLFPGYETWETGLYASYVDLSDEPGAPGGHELAIELFQQVALTPSIVLQPDLQWILDPGGEQGPDDALVFTLRIELTL